MGVYQIGRVGRIWAAKESTYGTAPALASTDAIRHLNVALNTNPRNRVDSPERHLHPSQAFRFTRRTTADWALGGIFYPSGTLNTLPDHTDFLECGLGNAPTNTPNATTVLSGSSTTGATLNSGTGMVVGQPILINVTTGSPVTGRKIVWLQSVAGAAITWLPALASAPAIGDSVKTCTGYSLATALPSSLYLAHYLTSVNKAGEGMVVNQLKFMLDANDEIRWEASGPMRSRGTPAGAPGSFTTAGSTPPSGLVGGLRVGTVGFDMLKMVVTINNAMELDNYQFGTSQATGYFRKGKRKVDVEINSMFSDDVTLMTAAENTTDNIVSAQCGNVEGSIVAMYMPLVELEVPDYPDDDETMEHAFKGVAKGSVTGNDEFRLAVA